MVTFKPDYRTTNQMVADRSGSHFASIATAIRYPVTPGSISLAMKLAV
jgi:hypothetical protein